MAQIGAEMIFSILMSSSIHSNFLVFNMSHTCIKWNIHLLSDQNKIQTHNHLVHRWIPNYLAKLTRLVFVDELQHWKKYLEQIKEVKQNWTGVENFGNCFLVVFDCYYKSFVFVKKTVPKLYLHPILSFFLNFLISKDPNFWVVWQLMKQLVYCLFMLDIKHCFTCGESKLSKMLQSSKIWCPWLSEYFSFALYTMNNDSNFWR